MLRWRRSILTIAIAASCTWCVSVVRQVHSEEQSPSNTIVDPARQSAVPSEGPAGRTQRAADRLSVEHRRIPQA